MKHIKHIHKIRRYLSNKQITLLFSILLLIALPIFLLAVNKINEFRERAAGTSIPSFSHVFVIIMENHSVSQIAGSSSAPYINQLISQYGYAANYQALFHPSLPNYIALTSGGNQGITTDCDSCRVSAPSIFDELEKAGKTWKAYMESMPSNCAGADASPYLHHHNPPAYYSSLLSSGSCAKNDVAYTQFSSDLASGNIANFVWILPNANNDMHNGNIQQGDTWLSQEVPKILASSAYQQNGLLVITFDEGDKNLSPNQVVTIIISPLGKQAYKSTIAYTHYSLLRTISDGLGVQPLGSSASTNPMSDFFNTGNNPSPTSGNGTPTATPAPCVMPSMTPGVTPTQIPSPGTSPTIQPHAGKAPFVQGAQIIDPSTGKVLMLRGTQIASPLNFISGWNSGQDPTQYLNPQVFAAIKSWNMNALRLPISLWEYNTNPSKYMGYLDPIVQQANAAGLYVILDNHDDDKSGSPYGVGCAIPKAEDVIFWKFIAGHYANNPMVMFDLINEPNGITAQNYLNGGETVNCPNKPAVDVGMQAMVNAIRQAGANQIIVTIADITAQNPTIKLNDPNIMYTVHIYAKIGTQNATQWDQAWGSLIGKAPLYYGEWAVLPNSLVPAQCQPYTPANADTLTNNFLQYMQQRNANWTAWEFRPYYLITSQTAFTPTTFAGNWTACNTGGQEGMGTDVKNYLQTVVNTQAAMSFATKKTPTPTIKKTPTPTNAKNPSPTSAQQPTPTCPISSPFPTDTPTSIPSNGPTTSVSPTSQSFCGQTCNTDVDCDQSGVSCGVCDPNAKVCTQGSSPSSTTQPTSQPSNTPTKKDDNDKGSIKIHFEGIDPENNPKPHHPQRDIELHFYKTQDFSQTPDASVDTTVTFDSSDPNGSFVNTAIDLSSVPQGTYYVLAKSPEGSLSELLTQQPIPIAPGTPTMLNGTSSNTNTTQNFRMGDLNNDNVVDITDYNILVDCYGIKVNSTGCTNHNINDQTKGVFADLNDDGEVNGIDYNILLRNFGQSGYGATTSAQ